MGMGDQGSGHRTPGIDPGIGGPAVQPFIRAFNHCGSADRIKEIAGTTMRPDEDQDFREAWAQHFP
jgi:hypothetical protein